MNFRIVSCALLILPLALGSIFSQTHISGGEISGIWYRSGSPYYIEGNCIVTSNSTLQIEAGVLVLMEPYMRIKIEGRLLAIGTVNDTIKISATDTSEGCEGLDFVNLNLNVMDSSRMEYCSLTYGKASPSPDRYMHGGALYFLNSSKMVVSNCLFAHNRTRNILGEDGAHGAPGTIQGEDGEDGECASTGKGGAIYCGSSGPTIRNCAIIFNRTGNAFGGDGGNGGNAINSGDEANGGNGGAGGYGCAGDGGGIFLTNSNAHIIGNLIANNETGLGIGGGGGNGGSATAYGGFARGGDGADGGFGEGGAGGGIATHISNAKVQNNVIIHNYTGYGEGGDGGDGGTAWGSTGFIIGTRGNGGDGVGGSGYTIYSQNGLVQVNLCTITDNEDFSFGSGGSGLTPGLSLDGTHIIAGNWLNITNCIIWNNTDPSITTESQVSYSCVEGGIGGIGNIDVEPWFVQGPGGAYYLSQTAAGQSQQSQCVDAGNPSVSTVDGTTRTDEVQDTDILDMGYHYQIGGPHGIIEKGFTEIPASFVLHPPYPNPFNPSTSISFDLPQSGAVRLAIYNISGEMVEILADGDYNPGNYSIRWSAEGLPSGIYFAQLRAEDFVGVRKLLLLK